MLVRQHVIRVLDDLDLKPFFARPFAQCGAHRSAFIVVPVVQFPKLNEEAFEVRISACARKYSPRLVLILGKLILHELQNQVFPYVEIALARYADVALAIINVAGHRFLFAEDFATPDNIPACARDPRLVLPHRVSLTKYTAASSSI